MSQLAVAIGAALFEFLIHGDRESRQSREDESFPKWPGRSPARFDFQMSRRLARRSIVLANDRRDVVRALGAGDNVMKLYVGNLSYNTTQDALEAAFREHGEVEEVAIINDRDTGRPRGFAFVTMPNDEEARAAMESLSGRELDGRTISINEARPKPERSGGRR